jgi:hypothetical protein
MRRDAAIGENRQPIDQLLIRGGEFRVRGRTRISTALKKHGQKHDPDTVIAMTTAFDRATSRNVRSQSNGDGRHAVRTTNHDGNRLGK